MAAATTVDWDAVFSSDTEDEAAGRAKVEKKMGLARQQKESGNSSAVFGKFCVSCIVFRSHSARKLRSGPEKHTIFSAPNREKHPLALNF